MLALKLRHFVIAGRYSRRSDIAQWVTSSGANYYAGNVTVITGAALHSRQQKRAAIRQRELFGVPARWSAAARP